MDKRSQIATGGKRVVATAGVDNKLLAGADVKRERGRAHPVKPHPRPVGAGGKGLRAVAAVDHHAVPPGPALVEVAVITRVPDQPVIAGPAQHLVVAVTPGQTVPAVTTIERVAATLAQDRVVA